MGTAFNVDLGFKFENKEQEKALGVALKNCSLYPEDSNHKIVHEEDFSSAMHNIFPNNKTDIEELLSTEYHNDCFSDLISGIEHVSLRKTGVKIQAVGHGEIEELIPKFMLFIIALGGKPLMCKFSEGDYEDPEVFKFKANKNGEIIEV